MTGFHHNGGGRKGDGVGGKKGGGGATLYLKILMEIYKRKCYQNMYLFARQTILDISYCCSEYCYYIRISNLHTFEKKTRK